MQSRYRQSTRSSRAERHLQAAAEALGKLGKVVNSRVASTLFLFSSCADCTSTRCSPPKSFHYLPPRLSKNLAEAGTSFVCLLFPVATLAIVLTFADNLTSIILLWSTLVIYYFAAKYIRSTLPNINISTQLSHHASSRGFSMAFFHVHSISIGGYRYR